jgi:hypothetical protein
MSFVKAPFLGGLAVILGCCFLETTVEGGELTLVEIQRILAGKKFVDLTHAFEPGIPRWHGFPDEKRETIYWYEKGRGSRGEGFFAETFSLVGQWGTHVDPPAHFIKGLRTVDQITLPEMILPLVVIDVHAEAAKNADYTLSLERVKNGRRITAPFPAAHLWRCEQIGRSAGRMAPRWRTKMPKRFPIIPAGPWRP